MRKIKKKKNKLLNKKKKKKLPHLQENIQRIILEILTYLGMLGQYTQAQWKHECKVYGPRQESIIYTRFEGTVKGKLHWAH